MSNYWLKMIGTTEIHCPNSYTRKYVEFRGDRPRQIHRGDHVILYAVGGSKRVFALAKVTSEVKDNDHEGWPYRVDIDYVLNLDVSSGVPIDKVSTDERDLLRPIQAQNSYFKLSHEEFERAELLLREATDAQVQLQFVGGRPAAENWDAAAEAARQIREAGTYDFDACRDQRKLDREHAEDHLR